MQIDLFAPTIPETQKVWRLFPGDGYQFLENFQEQGVAFLDLPDIILPDGDLRSVNDWGSRIAHSRAVRDFITEFGPDEERSIMLDDFADQSGQGHGRTRQAIINFYQVARPNDIIVLPSPARMGRIFIGQLGDTRRVRGFSPERYGRTPIPARTIDWIDAIRENTVSTRLSESLRNQHAFTLLGESLYQEVFSLAYGSFVRGETHVATVYNQDTFRDADAAFLSNVIRLAAAACLSLDNGDDLETTDLVDILLENPPIEYSCIQESDIHSEGFTRYIAQKIVPLVAVALATSYIQLGHVAQTRGAEAVAQEIQRIVVLNSSPNADPRCTARVSEAVARIYRMTPMDKTLALCDAGRSTGGRGIRPSARPNP